MLHRVLSPDVDNHSDARLEIHDVGKILFRANAEVRAVWRERPLERRDDVLKRLLVRDEILGRKISALLRHGGKEPPELTIAERVGKSRRGLRRRQLAGSDRENRRAREPKE